LFKDDALIFDDLKSSYVTITSKSTNQSIKVCWNNYPHLGIWKPLNKAPFLCIEPWNGMADELDLKNDFKDKFGVINLDPNESFKCSYTIENSIK
jgi:galactose mutarotase-like enzyme